jgi:hypothetical protein
LEEGMARLISPWSVKGIDDETRELARRKAKNSGVNIGAWINRAILDHGSQEHSGATDLPNVAGDNIPENRIPNNILMKLLMIEFLKDCSS